MRVVGGSAKGRRLVTFSDVSVRPTTDRVREAIFNVLVQGSQNFKFKKALDLFAGTGALGVEALSRGVEQVFFIDKNRRAAEVIKKNLALCGFTDRARVLIKDAKRALEGFKKAEARFGLIFIDAPYADFSLMQEALLLIVENRLLEPGGVVVCEVSKKHSFAEPPAGLRLVNEKKYGDTLVYFLEAVK